MIYKVLGWLARPVGIAARDTNFNERGLAALTGILKSVFSHRIGTLCKVFVLDILLQQRIAREDFLRWLMHMLICVGFILLLLMHALESLVTANLFDDYYATINPFFFLRNLFGSMVLAGVAVALFRRFVMKVPRLKTRGMDVYAILIVAVIMTSGFLLEGLKITSYTSFKEMAEEYGGIEETEEDFKALESYWVANLGTVSTRVKAPFDADVLEAGQELHEDSCIECHSAPQWAFGGWITASVLTPMAAALDQAGFREILWYLHFLACFIGLAYLPFSKMLHIFSTPLSLLVNSVSDPQTSSKAAIATRQALEVDACTQCGTCSLRCSAAAAYDVLGNEAILPAEKMRRLKQVTVSKTMAPADVEAIRQGLYLCSNCDRCTVVCPAGINLRDLWFNVREDLLQNQGPDPLMLSPFSFYRGLNQKRLAENVYREPLKSAYQAMSSKGEARLHGTTPIAFESQREQPQFQAPATFSYCFGCQTCTTVCPVVAGYEAPEEALDLLPHQVMNCMALGLADMAAGAKMLWVCSTCYQCQEHCPQEVQVTDIFYDLKNKAAAEWTASAVNDPAPT